MDTKKAKTVVKAFVLFGLVLGSTVDVMARRINWEMFQQLRKDGMSYEPAVALAERVEEQTEE
ncbi:hypothetical protein AGMMS49531_00060 [Endomicrobiia bacterium]|nr:hypothetical protein AGMMS49531_00060 [Endomicrobiia bacterium]